MRWIITEHSIPEHKPDFTLRLPQNYQLLSLLIKENPTPNNPRAGGPYLYIRTPEGEKEYEVTRFRHIETGESLEGPYEYVGSYQDRGYYKVKHLFVEVKLIAVE